MEISLRALAVLNVQQTHLLGGSGDRLGYRDLVEGVGGPRRATDSPLGWLGGPGAMGMSLRALAGMDNGRRTHLDLGVRLRERLGCGDAVEGVGALKWAADSPGPGQALDGSVGLRGCC
jgi:hypothetical protein